MFADGLKGLDQEQSSVEQKMITFRYMAIVPVLLAGLQHESACVDLGSQLGGEEVC